jgi:hypothetical protein
MRQRLGVFMGAVAMDVFNRVHDQRMERAAAIVEQAGVGDIVGQGVLEGVLQLGEEACLVEELGGLQTGKPTAQVILPKLGNCE